MESNTKKSFWSKLGDVIECLVCERKCKIRKGRRGVCGNRININGELKFIGYGKLSAIESRPIEIKPFFHYWPGSTALTFSGWGCNFKCPWCQNWHLSTIIPDFQAIKTIHPESLIKIAIKGGDEGICASFNEPGIHLEYLLDVFELASKNNLYSCIVSNGYLTLRAIEALAESGLTGFKIDVKGCPEVYRRVLGVPNAEIPFRNARKAMDLGIHVEIVFLVVTGVNDNPECIEWVLRKHVDLLGADVPLHINRYYPAYKYHKPSTSIEILNTAREKALKLGIKFVYIGNVLGHPAENTYCPRCGKTLIIRHGWSVIDFNVDANNRCPRCGEKIPIYGKYINKNRIF